MSIRLFQARIDLTSSVVRNLCGSHVGLPRKEVKFALYCLGIKNGRPHTVLILIKHGDGYKRVRCHEIDGRPGVKPSSNRVFGIEQVVTRSLIVKQPTFN